MQAQAADCAHERFRFAVWTRRSTTGWVECTLAEVEFWRPRHDNAGRENLIRQTMVRISLPRLTAIPPCSILTPAADRRIALRRHCDAVRLENDPRQAFL
jgi:hypothetical protein